MLHLTKAMEPKEKMETPFLESWENTDQADSKEAQGPTVSELERLIDLLTEEKLRTQKRLEEKIKCVLCERDALRKELDSKSEEVEALSNEVVELERIHDGCLLEKKVLYQERMGLVQEKREDRRRFNSTASRLSREKTCLEERLQRYTKTTQIFIERVFSVLKSSIDMMGVCEDGEGNEDKEEEDVEGEVVDVEVKELFMIQGYESELKAVEMALKRRERKMEEMRREIELLQASLAEARKDKSG